MKKIILLFTVLINVLSINAQTEQSIGNGHIEYGSHTNPASYYGQNFTMSNTIYSNGDLTLTAENQIKLLPGFEVKPGGTFIGKIGIYKPNCSFNFTGNNPCDKKDLEIQIKETIGNENIKTEIIETPFNENIETEIKDTAVNENIETNEDLIIYPNPVSDNLNIIHRSQNSIIKITITDYIGKIIYEVANPQNSNNVYNIDFSGFPEGLYFVLIQTNNKIITKKIIKK